MLGRAVRVGQLGGSGRHGELGGLEREIHVRAGVPVGDREDVERIDLGPGLTERGHRYELDGQAVVEVTADDSAIEARVVKRPARTPEWTVQRLGASTEVRRFLDTLKTQLARWRSDE